MARPGLENASSGDLAMKKIRGFTLIEMLVVLVVIGILAAIAVPSYQNQMRKGTRSAAQALMADIANKQQFYLQAHRTYWDCASPCTNMTTLGIAVPQDVGNFYSVGITKDDAATPPTFLITASPKSGTRQYGDGDITLNSAGTKMPADKW
jgi:type IV pilus assembly protein PilE